MGEYMGKLVGRTVLSVHKLNHLAILRATKRGYLGDGGGLYLQISKSGLKSWVFRFRSDGRLREMGLGPFPTRTLAEAREVALACRKQRLTGIDPIRARQESRIQAKLDAAKALTFEQCAHSYIETHQASWSNPKHAAQWRASLVTYAYPHIGNIPIQQLDVGHVLKVIEPIWTSKTETASHLRGRIENIIDWARVRKLREGDNPARWKGHLDHTLPSRAKVQKVQHHAALPQGKIINR